MAKHRRITPSPARSAASEDEDDEDRLLDDDDESSAVEVQPAKPWSPDTVAVRAPATTRSGQPRGLANFLPHEILVHIFKKLTARDDQRATLLVSRAWCQCSVELLWHKLSINELSSLIKMLHIISRKDQTFHYATFIRRLNFSNHSSQMTDPLFTRLAPCVRLERLTLSGCNLLTDISIIPVFSSCPALIAVDLSGVTEVTDLSITVLAQTALKLQGINITKCKRITDAAVRALAKHAPLLRRVKLHGLPLLTDVSVIAIARQCPLLLEIDLSDCKGITDVAIREVWEHQRHLRELQLANVTELTDDSCPVPPVVKSYSNPFATSTYPSEPTSPKGLPPLLLPAVFDHLRILDMTSCSHLTDAAIDGIISNSPKIRHINLSKCTGLTDESLVSIGKLGRHLHFVHLGHVTEISDRGVTQLVGACSRIRYIDLACCSNLSDMSVLELASLPKLRRVGLVRLPNLTDNAVFALGEKHTLLERIHLSYCDNISVGAIHFLLHRLNRLTHLSLTGVPGFRRKDLRKFCRSPPKEFNAHQRTAFCVYSGKGVSELRRYLNILANRAMDVDREHDLMEDADAGTFSAITPPIVERAPEHVGEVERDGDESSDVEFLPDDGDDSVIWRAPATTASRVPSPPITRPHRNGTGSSSRAPNGNLRNPAAGPSVHTHPTQPAPSPPHRHRPQSAPRASQQGQRRITPPTLQHHPSSNVSMTSGTSASSSGLTIAAPAVMPGQRSQDDPRRHRNPASVPVSPTGSRPIETRDVRAARLAHAAEQRQRAAASRAGSAGSSNVGEPSSRAFVFHDLVSSLPSSPLRETDLPAVPRLGTRHRGVPAGGPRDPPASSTFREPSEESLPTENDRELIESLEAALGDRPNNATASSASRRDVPRGRGPRTRSGTDPTDTPDTPEEAAARRGGVFRNTFNAAEQYASSFFGRGN